MKINQLARNWAICLIVLSLSIVPAVVYAQVEGELVAEGFNGPMGVLVDPDGNVWVIDSGLGGDTQVETIDPASGQASTAMIGDTARIVMIAPDGTQTEIVTLPSVLIGQEATGGSRLALANGVLYATTGGWVQSAMEEPPPNHAVVLKIEDGQATEVARLWELERDENPDGFLVESHPYGIAAAPGNRLFVADAAGNDLISINPNTGRMGVVTVFAGIPTPLPDFTNPTRGGANEADPVPTGVTFDADGNAYVSLLPGVPFLPGTAKVVQISADGATVSDYATGLTSLTDIRTAPDGQLYAVQFAEFGEQGPAPNSGAIIRIQEGDSSEIVLSELSFPTSIGFSADGDAYVTINGVGAPGSGAVVRYAGLTSMAGMAMTGTLTETMALTETGALTETVALTDTMAMTEMLTATEAMAETAAITATAEATAEEPGVSASDQASDGASIVVDSVTATVPGWMVIHIDENGSPGAVLGQAAVSAGTTDNVAVTLDTPLEGETTLWAMLHVDEGTVGTYEFPGPDLPVISNGMVVMQPFTASMAADEPAVEAAPTPAAMPVTGVGLAGAAVNTLLALGATLATLAAGSWVVRRRRA